MCSWCWGFSPVLQKIKKTYTANDIRLVLTPFRIDTTQPMDDTLRYYVLDQWYKVHQCTQQAFDFRFAMPVEFIYNTGLTCRAIKAFSKQLPKQELEYMHALQQAFYTENQDLTKQDVLVKLADTFKLDIDLFTKDLSSKGIESRLEKDFALSQQLAVQSYPTLMAEYHGNYTMLANGYVSYTELVDRIYRVL